MTKSSKLVKKIKGKQQLILGDHGGIEFSDEPQLSLAILNIGLSNGISTEVLVEEISKHAHLTDIILPQNKSYCFLVFSDIESSRVVCESMNGAPLAQGGSPILMSYCKNLPDVKNRSQSSKLPDGLILIPDCISPEIEERLLSGLEWDLTEDGALKNRKVQHFGFEFIYGANNVDPAKPLTERRIPEACKEIWKSLPEKFCNFNPDQLTVNRYESGHGIPAHCDTHSCFEDPIVSLSLGSSIVMEFRQPETGQHCSVLLPRRSLLIMSGDSRYGWTHGITPRHSDIITSSDGKLTVQKRELRTSFTFRKLRIPPDCSCAFQTLCDVKKSQEVEVEVTDHLAAKLEIENVHKVYNEIGSHFSETRHSPWPNVEGFIRALPVGAVLLDVGCGNGKYLGVGEEILKFGCDRSDTLLKVCSERKFNVFQCDCLQIPVRDGSVDACISIAVIHHLATSERRFQAILEMSRVLVKGGTALIYVWAKDQLKNKKKSTYLLQHQGKDAGNQPETATLNFNDGEIQLPVHQNRTQFKHKNVLVPWKLKQKEIPHDQQKVFLRYYHVFEEGELEDMCKSIPEVEIVKSYYDQGNHCVILKKR